jgi:hypothetical protein
MLFVSAHMLNLNELFVITTYFNPCGYKNRLENYHLFMAGMKKAGVNCITIECVFEDQDFELPESIDVIRIRAKSLLWQKERLLNLAASWLHLPVNMWLGWTAIFYLKTKTGQEI